MEERERERKEGKKKERSKEGAETMNGEGLFLEGVENSLLGKHCAQIPSDPIGWSVAHPCAWTLLLRASTSFL